jgi:hypothetical protein
MDITSIDIIRRFKQYAKNKGYTLKVSGDYAYRNTKLKIMRYERYNKDTNTILIYEEGVGKYKIPFVQEDTASETTFQRRILEF